MREINTPKLFVKALHFLLQENMIFDTPHSSSQFLSQNDDCVYQNMFQLCTKGKHLTNKCNIRSTETNILRKSLQKQTFVKKSCQKDVLFCVLSSIYSLNISFY